ncbi:CPBP family intramembrane glutamic endopeptidase [Halosimplex carlsbadense]|uniref:CPBP family intramembrane glutamic endopeptidase n=1 Tax=Halosimplex carlsbadense TaxID=171164 RepID=UPI0019553F8D|nr:type II CAAX endopeptidase family protein [Halosimplex carlsbadense]
MGILTDETEASGDAGGRTSPARAVGFAVLLTVASFLVTLAAGIAFLIPLFILEVNVESTPAFVGLTAVGQVGFLAFGYAVARYRGMSIPIAVPSLRQVGYAAAATVAALASAVGLSVVLAALDLVPGSVIEDAALTDPTLLLWLGFLSIVLVAPAEEFLFRGVVQGTLREAFGPVGAVAGASLLFGSLHLANYTGTPSAVVTGALLIAATGAVLGTVYELTDNLAVPIAAHALYNVVLFAISYLAV